MRNYEWTNKEPTTVGFYFALLKEMGKLRLVVAVVDKREYVAFIGVESYTGMDDHCSFNTPQKMEDIFVMWAKIEDPM